MTYNKLQQLEEQQRKVYELESALSWVKACKTGDAELAMKDRTNIRDINTRPVFFTVAEYVDADTYNLILAAIKDDIKKRLDIERRIFEEM